MRFVVRRKTAVAAFPVQTHLRGSSIRDSLAKTTSMWPRQRSGDAEDIVFPFSVQERILEARKIGESASHDDERTALDSRPWVSVFWPDFHVLRPKNPTC